MGTPRPFRIVEGELQFHLRPALSASWFVDEARSVSWQKKSLLLPEDTLACALLGGILLVYHNPEQRDTWGPDGVRPRAFSLDGSEWIQSGFLSGKHAKAIRERGIGRLDVMLA